jgi:2-C-methyl-D-erythritol 4-phosphate cytidylyltransferase
VKNYDAIINQALLCSSLATTSISTLLSPTLFPFQCTTMPPNYFALIPAAGIGARMGGERPKQYMQLGGKPMLRHVLDTFVASPAITHTFVVVGADDGYIEDMMSGAPHITERATILYEGGATRHESVLNGLHAIRAQVRDEDWILVHDAARPGLTGSLIDKLICSLREDSTGGLLAMPLVDTLKRSGTDVRVDTTVPRDCLWTAQTPQMFRYALLRQALESVDEVTDEASAVEALGLRPKLVEGSLRNFKVTLPQDALLAELFLEEPHE